LYEAQLRFDVNIDMKLRNSMNAGLAYIAYISKRKKNNRILKSYDAMEETAKKGKCVNGLL